MPWWGVLLIIIGCQALFLLVWWLVTRKNTSWVVELQKTLEESGLRRMKEELEVEKKTRETVADQLKTLASEYKAINAWYNAHREQIDQEASDEYEKLVSDSSALDAKLDALLGIQPGGQAGASGEG